MRLSLCFALLAAALAVPAASARAADPILVGHLASMTGDTATFGISTDEGIRLAVDEINSKGGVLGRPIQLLTEDDRSVPEEAVTVAKKLITRDHVVAILGEVASTRSLAAAPVAQRAKIPMISPGSTNPKVTEKGNYIFRVCFIDPFQGAAAAQFAMKSLHLKRFAILYDVKQDYATGLRQFFMDTVKKNGGEIVADESYSTGDVDFKGQLTKIKNENPEAVYIPGYYTEAGLIMRQARELGLNVPLIGGDGWDSDKTCAIAGPAADGDYFTNHYASDDKSPAVQDFIKAYEAKYNGKLPDAMAILGYDAVRVLADAITRAGTTDGPKLRDALAATKNFPGASGTITMDAHRNAEKPIVVLRINSKIVNGQLQWSFSFVDRINP